MDILKIQIEGMGCGHCVARVKQALGQVEGVQVETVAIGKADVRYDASRVAPERIRQAVEDLGYVVRPAEAVA